MDKLCSWEVNGKTVRPKLIASTATIRKAGDQVHATFLREVRVFPPNGLDIHDNFFALQRSPSEDMPGRRYIGLCGPGRRLKVALIRVYVALLSATQYLYDKKAYGREVDPWMTLVGYFNSMRELGGMRRLVDDDVRTRLGKMDQRGLVRRTLHSIDELTSRKDSTDIPDVLDHLEVAFDAQMDTEREEMKRKGRYKDLPRRPLDVLLATNMVSVGVDVQRLGLMVMGGQPKTTAEYIQATSRVGRKIRAWSSRSTTGPGPGTSRTTSDSSITTPRSTTTSRPCRSRPLPRGAEPGPHGPAGGVRASPGDGVQCQPEGQQDRAESPLCPGGDQDDPAPCRAGRLG